jgi:hypothetical protein
VPALVTLFGNNPSTTATSSSGTSAPTAGTTETWTVASSAAFPAAVSGTSQFHIADPVQPTEIVAVTNVSGTTWSVTRGAESTTPVAHATGATYYQIVTGGDLTAFTTALTTETARAVAAEALAISPFTAADAGYLAWNFDVGASLASGAGQALGNSVITLNRVNLRTAASVTNVVVYLGTLGSGLTSGQNFAGLYNSSGTLIGTSADQTTTWNTGGSGGLKTIPLTGGPFACPAGFYWVALLSNESAGTPAAFGRAGNLSSTLQNAGLSAATLRWCTNGTGTSLPSTITPSSNSANSSAYWAALS